MAYRRRRKKPTGAGEVPVASFSDIAFLLIIFFIIVTTLNTTLGLLTESPAAQKSESQDDREKVPTISIHDNQIRFKDAVMRDARQLREELAKLQLPSKATPEEKIVMLEVSGNTNYQTHFSVVAAIQQTGGLLTLVESEGEGE